MGKRQFRSEDSGQRPEYPTLDTVDGQRRQFLVRLGGAVLGASALGTLAGCGDRQPVTVTPDHGLMLGEPPLPDAGADSLRPDMEPPLPDAGADSLRPDMEPPTAGEPPMPPSRYDGGTPSPDIEPPIGGDAPQPPARADAGAPPDAEVSMGFAPPYDAEIDKDGGGS